MSCCVSMDKHKSSVCPHVRLSDRPPIHICMYMYSGYSVMVMAIELGAELIKHVAKPTKFVQKSLTLLLLLFFFLLIHSAKKTFTFKRTEN